MTFKGERFAVRKLAFSAATFAALISPAHASPAHASPALISPAHASPAHASPAHTRPAQAGLAQASPAHRRRVHARPMLVASGTVETDSGLGASVAGDFNGDGKTDLAVAVNSKGGSVGLFLGDGNGSFAPATFYATGGHPISLATGDFNGDGKDDLVVGNSDTGTVSILLGKGNGTLVAASSVVGLIGLSAVAVGDVNNDGRQDLIVASGNGNTSFVTILLGHGDGTFTKGLSYTVPSSADAAPCCVAIGDINRDGKPDFLVATGGATDGSPTGSTTTSIFPGTGDGAFGAARGVDTGLRMSTLVLDDLNGDGSPDVIAGNGNSKATNGRVNVLLNTGAGTFGQPQAYLSGQDVTSVAAAHFTGGRYDDLAVGNSEGALTLLRNDGKGSFTTDSSFSVGDNVAALVAADFNGDGLPDLAVVDGHGGKIVVYLDANGSGGNTIGGTATPPATLPALPPATLPALPSATSTATARPAATSAATRTATISTGTATSVTSGSTATTRATATPTMLPSPTATSSASSRPTGTPQSRSFTPTSTTGGTGGPSSRPTTTPTSSVATASASNRATSTPASTAYPSASTGTAAPPMSAVANAGRSPSMTLSPSTARPGVSVTVNGRDFGPNQTITLALDGEALTTRPAVIVSDRQGSFTAMFVTPRALLPGQNTVAASAAPGGRNTVAPLAGAPGVAGQFYFAAGEESSTAHASIALLNSDSRPAQVRLTFYGRTGGTTVRSVTVGATRERTLTVASLHIGSGPFGLAVRADRAIAATLTLSRVGRDGDILLGSPDLATHWGLAEGYTGLTFRETVAILNPGDATAHVTLHLLPVGGRGARAVTLRVAARSEAVADINRLLPHQSLSVSADSDRPVVVARALTFSSDRAGTGFGLTLRTGSTTSATTWYFAEGSTLDRFQTFLTVLNPNRARARVTAQFYGSSGRALGQRTLIVAAQSRGTLKLNTFLRANGIASVVTSDRPVLIERAEYFGAPNSPHIAGSDVFGRNGPATRWSFPGGAGAGMNEFLLLYNPSTVTIPIEATFYGRNGETRRYRFTVPPHVRGTIVVRRVLANFASERGVTLRATNGHGFVAEQTLFTPDHRSLLSTQGFAQ